MTAPFVPLGEERLAELHIGSIAREPTPNYFTFDATVRITGRGDAVLLEEDCRVEVSRMSAEDIWLVDRIWLNLWADKPYELKMGDDVPETHLYHALVDTIEADQKDLDERYWEQNR